MGGGGRRIRSAAILRRFAQLCGGSRAHIGIISAISDIQDAGYRYERAFRDLGVDRVSILKFETQADCESERDLEVLDSADGIFLMGRVSRSIFPRRWAARGCPEDPQRECTGHARGRVSSLGVKLPGTTHLTRAPNSGSTTKIASSSLLSIELIFVAQSGLIEVTTNPPGPSG